MQDEYLQRLQNQFMNNPQVSEQSIKDTDQSKQKLAKKRKIIQQELRELMSRVDEYELQKNIVMKKANPIQNNHKRIDLKVNQEPFKNKVIDINKKSKSVRQNSRSYNKNNEVILPSSRVKVSQKSQKSRQALSNKTSQQQQRYKNYLPEIDFRVPLPNKISSDDRRKKKLVDYVQKAYQYQKQAIKKIQQLKAKKYNLTYLEFIEVETQIDDVFINSLKSKIECLMKI